MNTELYIEGRRLDITTDISTLLNFAIDDVKDFSARSTTFSKTIVLPGTANNNQHFGHIFQVGQSNTYNSGQPNVGSNFNAAKSAACILFQDQIQTFKGVLRLLQVNYYDGLQGQVDYEVSVFGTLVGLNSILSGSLLQDLDFSAYDHVYNDANIVNSWDNPGGSGVYYPLIDYGTYSTNKHDWDIKTFRPGLYAKEYVDKIFSAAGKRYISPLFDTPRFKKLVTPHSKKTMTVALTDLYSAHSAATFYGAPPQTEIGNHSGGAPVRFTVTSGTGFTPNAGPDKTVFTFNGTVTTNISLTIDFTGHYNFVGLTSSNAFIYLWKNGDGGSLVWSTTINTTPFIVNATVSMSIAPGDTLMFTVGQDFSIEIINFQFDTNDFSVVSAGGSVSVPISIGDLVKMNDHIPQNIRQIDFLIGLVKLWNLYITEDKNDENLFYITPYIDFYSKNLSNAVDWTHKLNRNKAMKSRPMSELNAKIYKFQFKSDSDYYNDLYRKRYNEGYGDRVFDSEFEFTQQTSQFEIIFSATPLIGYGGEDKVYPTIFKQSNATEENIDSNIRILQTKKITGVTAWNMKNGATVLNTLTRYGYAGHLDDPITPANDLNFGAPKELFFILTAGSLSSNQFNVYWSGYMREITDKDSKLVTGNFYLNSKDILNLDFSKYVYVDGIAFRLNAIKDYDASNPNDCIVELFKVNNPSYSETPANDGPPAGCYLLWSDDNTLDWDDDEPLLYGDCTSNPGDGGPPPPGPPTTFYMNWTFSKGGTSIGFAGGFRIYLNGTLVGSSTSVSDNGTFEINAGDVIKVDVYGSITKSKNLTITNTVDGVIFTGSTTSATETHTFTVDASKDYSVVGTITNP
jgi:hypothetical protein